MIIDRDKVKIINEYGEFFFPQHGLKPCPRCGGIQGVHLNISATGCSVGTETNHKPDCPSLFCEHGIHFMQDCQKCDDAAANDGEYDDDQPEDLDE